MRALLDTSSFLWFIGGSERLSKNARKFIENFENELFMSAASLWGIAIFKIDKVSHIKLSVNFAEKNRSI